MSEEDETILEANKKILEEEKNIVKILTAKIDELNKKFGDTKVYTEDRIKKNPLAYVAGAFLGGMVAGLLIAKRKE